MTLRNALRLHNGDEVMVKKTKEILLVKDVATIPKGVATNRVVPQIKRNSILHIIRDCFCDVSMNNSRLFDADSALYFI